MIIAPLSHDYSMIIPLITISRSTLHGYKLILNSLLVLMGISTFTSKEFSFLQSISNYIPIKILLNPIKSPLLHHYLIIIPWLSHDYPINHHVFMINFPLYSIKILLNPIKSPLLHHYLIIVPWLSHDYPINHHVFMINFPLYSH